MYYIDYVILKIWINFAPICAFHMYVEGYEVYHQPKF
jgi:hypothetical protein